MIVIKSDRQTFGNNGIGWFPWLPIVWKGSGEYSRVLQNEVVHCYHQHQEVWTITFLPVILLCLHLQYPIWWPLPALISSYWFVYLLLALISKLAGRDPYIDHPMERDSRRYDNNNIYERPAYYWCGVFIQSFKSKRK